MPNLDLGFRIKYELGDNSSLDGFKSGDLVSVRKSRNSFQFEKIASVRELFSYKAYLDRVVDGDTLLVQIDLGFGIFIEERLRLRGLDAPEVAERNGQAAKKFVERELKGTNFLILKTYGSDIYDRYLVEVFYLKNEWKVEKIIEDGNFLNNRLLQEGLAIRI
ncbi:thermonuclease family protein [Leptospira sp. GIMC2001]|uniref:thermonuclease family protein n=1 Tax=Leptospira sp. GIMC2001 TaxID=1513297 RepID=UPI00234BF694|nr:thermonuclease family protein [Leptospira sp. GIMC2001]WCL49480.1 thermonuclease family protein [Leptospira sp. GIMC2001]